MKQARRGTIFGAYLKLTPVFIFLIPGMIAFTLHQQGEITLTSNDTIKIIMITTITLVTTVIIIIITIK